MLPCPQAMPCNNNYGWNSLTLVINITHAVTPLNQDTLKKGCVDEKDMIFGGPKTHAQPVIFDDITTPQISHFSSYL